MIRSHIRDFYFPLALLCALVMLGGAGCGDAVPEKASAPSTNALASAAVTVSGDTIARLHWLGKKRLQNETNAAGFMKIWNTPESARLEAQTLDKLATAPWRMRNLEDGKSKMENSARTSSNTSAIPNPSAGSHPRPSDGRGAGGKGNAISNQPSSILYGSAPPLLRPLLDDLVQEESYWEVSQTTNQPGELVVAIRLSSERAALWETNLPAALKSLGATSSTRPSTLSPQGPNSALWTLDFGLWTFSSSRAGDWSVISVRSSLLNSQSSLLADMVSRIQHDSRPFTPSPTNFWLETDFDLPRLSSAFSWNWNLPTNFPKVHLTEIGDGENVRTRGELLFYTSPELTLKPWNIPTNLFKGALVSFTAFRGNQLISRYLPWDRSNLGDVPNQAFLWAYQGIPLQTYLAVPENAPGDFVRRITENYGQSAKNWLASQQAGTFQIQEGNRGFIWTGLPFMSPQLVSADSGGTSFALFGFLPNGGIVRPFPNELRDILNNTNLLLYDWEVSGPRIEQWLYIGQTLRVMLHQSQLPFQSASMAFLKGTCTNLGPCSSTLTLSKTNTLQFARRSALGFNAFELHLLSDWFESPQFPIGLNTFLGPKMERSRRLMPSSHQLVAPSTPPGN